MYFIGVYTVERFSQRHGFDRLGSDMRCSTGLSKPRKTTLYSALKIVNQRNVWFQKITSPPPFPHGRNRRFPWRGSIEPKNLKKCMEQNWKFLGGGGEQQTPINADEIHLLLINQSIYHFQ